MLTCWDVKPFFVLSNGQESFWSDRSEWIFKVLNKESLSFREAGRRKAACSGSRERAALRPLHPTGSSRRLWGSFRMAQAQRMRASRRFYPDIKGQGVLQLAAIQAAILVLIMIFTLFPPPHLTEIRKIHDGIQIQRVGTGQEKSGWWLTPRKQRNRDFPWWSSG